MTLGRLRLAALLVMVAIGGFFIARSVSKDSAAAASAMAERFLDAACGEASDRGWSLLDGDGRTAEFGSEDGYLVQATEIDCAGFAWRVGTSSCDDGVCVVWLSVLDHASIPRFLAETGIVVDRTEKASPGANAGMAILQRWIFGDEVIVPTT